MDRLGRSSGRRLRRCGGVRGQLDEGRGGFGFGFGAFIAFFGLLAVLARNRTPDHWGLLVVGLGMFIVPFLGNGYNADLGASWTCGAAGAVAMILGGIGWVGGKPATEYGVNEIGSGQVPRSALSFWIGRAALVVGLACVLLGIAAHTTAAGVAVTIGLGGLTGVFAVWSLLAVDPTHDFLTLACAGFALFLAPWVGGFTGDTAALDGLGVGCPRRGTWGGRLPAG